VPRESRRREKALSWSISVTDWRLAASGLHCPVARLGRGGFEILGVVVGVGAARLLAHRRAIRLQLRYRCAAFGTVGCSVADEVRDLGPGGTCAFKRLHVADERDFSQSRREDQEALRIRGGQGISRRTAGFLDQEVAARRYLS